MRVPYINYVTKKEKIKNKIVIGTFFVAHKIELPFPWRTFKSTSATCHVLLYHDKTQ